MKLRSLLMKQLILSLIILSTISYGQEGNFVSIGLDPGNLIWGSDVNDPALDIQAKFGFREDLSEYGIFVESFKEIKYFNWGVFWHANIWSSFTQYKIPNWQILGGFEFSQIIRERTHASGGWWAGAANLIGRRNWDTWGIELQANYEWRPDIDDLIYSTYLNLIIYIDK